MTFLPLRQQTCAFLSICQSFTYFVDLQERGSAVAEAGEGEGTEFLTAKDSLPASICCTGHTHLYSTALVGSSLMARVYSAAARR